MKTKSIVAAVVMTLTSVTGMVSTAGVAHASGVGCKTTPRILASNPTDLYGYNLGIFSNKHLGKLYLGYIGGQCRMEYAEVHWDDNLYLGVDYGSPSIWIQDSHGNHLGQASTPTELVGYWTSNLVPIDGSGYYYSQPWLHVAFIFGSSKVPVCRPTDYYGNGHDFYTGGNEASHNWQVCAI